MNSTLKNVVIHFESETKHVVLHLPEIATIAEGALNALGQNRAASFMGELVTLGEAAVTAFEDAHAVAITPASIDELLPTPTPLPDPPTPAPAPGPVKLPDPPAAA